MAHQPSAVMGMTGAGKSTFIEYCTKPPERLSDDGLFSCTSRVSIHTTVIQGRTVHLLDTPGFNDSRQSDGEVLQELAFWLTAAYERDIKLSGIVYLHCITNIRLQGTAARALEAFKKMCGKEAYKGVVLATTMWNMVPVKDIAKAGIRHKEFYEKIRHDVIQEGGRLVRLSAGEMDAMKILHHIVQKDQRFTLAFQRELVDEGRLIYETEAGNVLFDHLNERFQSLQTMTDEAHTRMDAIVNTGRLEALDQLSDAASVMAGDMRLVDEEIKRTKVAFGDIQKTWEDIIHRDDEGLVLTAQRLERQLALESSRNEDDESAATASEERPTSSLSEASGNTVNSTCSSCTSQESMKLRLQELNRERRALAIRMGQRLSGRYTAHSRGTTTIGVIGTTLAAGQLIAALACVVM
ncbi:hypothetical protein PtrV1_06726 [Pyrenophora tritici-repentis]|uniref:GTPase n=2 Tax=Pyrenophora tritici-repentis TaxID=45151 RepID=A0A317AVW0_9PLEO|nr:uncharacterized protein PTRG_04275 [Pyrenophora tritici-repentis Pt-1C-BFP]KAA8619632.1 hypothetical protein PtrV1_06726 [Pyrenophora tritici-repentis]EDU47113.1 conserved hypothetical protein [Pyrenophora tritici-repentis Pt-1C-BFP]KAF7571471.1 GTPase [Pyrenophora tritici-repentis]KAI1510594.1 hypothetical protein Ptr86124_010399 [Pyrenophora tritici-repentis]KAI1528726.1 hypothetical protein PtrSN001A_008846 [Pyrenophora tritici-repentis]